MSEITENGASSKTRSFCWNLVVNCIVFLIFVPNVLRWIYSLLCNNYSILETSVLLVLRYVPFWPGVSLLIILFCAIIYVFGRYSLGEISSFVMPSTKRRIFFTVKTWNTVLKGYSHGYVTRVERREKKYYYSVIWIFGGISPTTDVCEDDVIRTDFTALKMLSMYLFGGGT